MSDGMTPGKWKQLEPSRATFDALLGYQAHIVTDQSYIGVVARTTATGFVILDETDGEERVAIRGSEVTKLEVLGIDPATFQPVEPITGGDGADYGSVPPKVARERRRKAKAGA